MHVLKTDFFNVGFLLKIMSLPQQSTLHFRKTVHLLRRA